MPARVDAKHGQRQRQKPRAENNFPEGFFRRHKGRHCARCDWFLRFRFQIRRANGREPKDNPQQSHQPDCLKREAPALRLLGHQRAHEQRRDDRPDGRAALQHAVAHRAILRRQQRVSRLDRARPVTRLEESEKRAAHHQALVARHKPRRETHRRPEQQHRGIKPPHAEAIRDVAEAQRPHGKRPAERQLDVAVLLLVKLELRLDPQGRVGKRLPIHVIDRRRQQQQAAHPPRPRPPPRWCGGVHAKGRGLTTEEHGGTRRMGNDVQE